MKSHSYWLSVAFFMITVLLAATSNTLTKTSHKSIDTLAIWPVEFEGKPLQSLGLSPREAGFVKNFPGHIERFSDGHREIIIRQILEPTRYLHSASTCFSAIGYDIKPLPVETNQAGHKMNCFQASPTSNIVHSQTLKVCEWIIDNNNQHWSDVSAWYWSAIFQRENTVWWSYAVAEVVKEPLNKSELIFR